MRYVGGVAVVAIVGYLIGDDIIRPLLFQSGTEIVDPPGTYEEDMRRLTGHQQAWQEVMERVRDLDLGTNSDTEPESEGDTKPEPDFPVPPMRPRDDDEIILYHYTFQENIKSILQSGYLFPSVQAKTGDAQLGDGQYFLDLTPQESSISTRGQHSAALFKRQWNWGMSRENYTAKDVGWLEFKFDKEDVEFRRELFTSRFPERGIYLYRNQDNLPIQPYYTGRTGTLIFQPGPSGYR